MSFVVVPGRNDDSDIEISLDGVAMDCENGDLGAVPIDGPEDRCDENPGENDNGDEDNRAQGGAAPSAYLSAAGFGRSHRGRSNPALARPVMPRLTVSFAPIPV